MIIKPQIQENKSLLTSNEEWLSSLDVKTSDGGKCAFEFAGHKDSPESKESKARDRGSGRNKRKFDAKGEELTYQRDFMKLI